MGYFLPFYLPNSPKNQNLEKNEKNTWTYHHFTIAYQKSWSYAILFLNMACNRCNCFFFILAYFLPFYPPNNRKNQNFEKMKKYPGDINILHRFNINDNHMMYGSWDTECDQQNFCHFGPLLAKNPNNPKNQNLKIKIWKNEKHLKILSFYTCVP